MQAPPPGYSNYPRFTPGTEPVPPGPPQVRFEAISEAWSLMRQDWATWVVAAFILFLLSIGISYPVSSFVNFLGTGGIQSPPFGDPKFYPLSLVQAVISQGLNTCFSAGMLGMCLRRLRGQSYTYGDMFIGLPRFFSFVGAGLLSGLLISVGMVFCLIPGFYLAGALAFAPLIVLDQKTGALEAIQISYANLSRHGLSMFVLMLATALLVALGVFACCVGVFFVAPIYFFVIAIHYHAFFPPQGGPEVAPGAAPQYSV